MNLAEFPFAMLSDRPPKDANTVQFQDTVEGDNGKRVKRTWTLIGGQSFGLPRASDEQVYVALMEVTREQGFSNRTIRITRYDLIKRMGWPHKGASYQRLLSALNRLLGVTIQAEKAFWDKEKRRYVDMGFHIIDNYALYDEDPGKKSFEVAETLPSSFITWNQVIFHSFVAGNIKRLDTALYFSLKSSVARRLYRYLDKKRYDGKSQFRIGIKKLAFEKLGMSRKYYPSHIKQELQRAHEELLESEFIQDVIYDAPRAGRDELVVYVFDAAGGPEEDEGDVLNPAPRFTITTTDVPSRDATVRDLLSVGVTPAVARQLVDDDRREAQTQLEYLHYRAAKDPAAVLVEAVRGKWEPPAAYVNDQATKSRQTEISREQEALARQEAEAKEREERRLSAFDAVLKSLEPSVRDELEALARQQVVEKSPLVAQRPQSRAFEAMYQEQLGEILKRMYPQRFADNPGDARE